MLQRFKQYILDKNLCGRDEVILVAVSGGVDSIALVDLFVKSDYKIAIAHVNHGMRSHESDLDEKLVRDLSNHLQLACHVVSLPEDLKARGNFQENARIFRNHWFREICSNFGYAKVALAHHKDDEVEGFMMNLSRSSGLKGLAGINAKSSGMIRPMLSFTKMEIYDYAIQNNLLYREDQSNFENKYLRNKIRNQVIPVWNQVQGNDVVNAIANSIHHLRESNTLLDELIERAGLVKFGNGHYSIVVDIFMSFHNRDALLFHIAHPFGFNRDQIDDFLKAEGVGKRVISSTHELVKERSSFIIKEMIASPEFLMKIDGEGCYHINGQKLCISIVPYDEVKFQREVIYLGFVNDPFPFFARNKKNGDQFDPLGMNGLKKSVKKLVTDHKLNSFEKENIIIFEREDRIIAVFPLQISEACRVGEQMKYILKIEYLGD